MGFWALVRFVSVRHAVRAPVRSALTLFGIALGVSMIVAMTAANNSILSAFRATVDRTAGKADLEVTGDEAGVDQGVADELAARSDLVSHVAVRIEQTTLLDPENGGAAQRVLVFGVDFLGDSYFLPFESKEGADAVSDPIALLNNPEAILISETLKGADHLSIGSPVHLRDAEGSVEFRVHGIFRETGASRAFGGQVVVMYLDAAQQAFGRRGRVDRIDLALAPGASLDAAKVQLQSIVGSRGSVNRPSIRATQIAQMTRGFQVALEVEGMIAMVVGMFLIYNAVSISVVQRRREIGILRCVGVSRGLVAATFLAEASILGLLGGVLGVAMGRALARAVIAQFTPTISRYYENIVPPTPALTSQLAVVGVTVGFAATLVASWVPARQAANTRPIETLRRDLHSASRARIPVRILVAVGLGLCGASMALIRSRSMPVGFAALLLLLLGAACLAPASLELLRFPLSWLAQASLGIAARLGVDNVSRELGRSSLTTCALMLATGMSITIAAYSRSYERTCQEWVEETFPADIYVPQGSPLADRNVIPFSPGVAERIRDIREIETVDFSRTMVVPTAGIRALLQSVGTENYLSHLQGSRFLRIVEGPDPVPPDALVHEPSAIVSENFAWRTGVHAGGHVELDSPTGTHSFKVVAVVVNYLSDQGLLLVDRKYSTMFWQDDRVGALEVYLKPGADPFAVAAAIRAKLSVEGPSEGLFVSTNAAMREESQKKLSQTFQVARASEFIAFAVAVLGVIGTMSAAVIDRTREIGVLRAIGARRVQILHAVMAEAGYLGLCSALVGTVSAIPSTFIVVRIVSFAATGWNIPFHFPAAAAARVTLSVVGFALLAGVVPGWRASKLKVTSALAYE